MGMPHVRAGPRESALVQLHALLDALGDDLLGVTLFCRSGSTQVVMLPLPQPARAAPETGCSGDIVRALRAAAGRLTLPQIQDAFAAERLEYSERTIKTHLADLKAQGWVDNDQDASPPGYGLLG